MLVCGVQDSSHALRHALCPTPLGWRPRAASFTMELLLSPEVLRGQRGQNALVAHSALSRERTRTEGESRGQVEEQVEKEYVAAFWVALRSKVFFHPDLYQAVVDYVTPSEMEHHSNHGPTTARKYRRTKGPLCVRLNAR